MCVREVDVDDRAVCWRKRRRGQEEKNRVCVENGGGVLVLRKGDSPESLVEGAAQRRPTNHHTCGTTPHADTDAMKNEDLIHSYCQVS